jgi:hypothetical protein
MTGHACCRVRLLLGTAVVIDQEFCPESLHPAARRELEARLLLHAAAASMAGLPWEVLWSDSRELSARPVSSSGNPHALPMQREQIIIAAAAALRLMAVDRPWLDRLLHFGTPKEMSR